MLASLRLQNFRGYVDSGVVDLRPLTLITGPNNSGKSTLLDAVLLLKQTMQDRSFGDPLVTAGPFVDLGSFHDIVRGGRSASKQSLTIELGLSNAFISDWTGGESDEDFPNTLSVRFSFRQRTNEIAVTRTSLRRNDRVVLELRRRGSGWSTVGVSQAATPSLDFGLAHFLPRVLLADEAPPNQRAFEEVLNVATMAGMQTSLWSSFLGSVEHIAPLRRPIPRYTIIGTVTPGELGSGGEDVLRALVSPEAKTGRARIIDLVGTWVRDHLEPLEGLRLVQIDREGTIWALLGEEPGEVPPINVANMGEGVSQLLPIVTSVLGGRETETLLIEQPEIHLHPAAQAELGDLFTEHVSEKRQFIVETHSEHILLRVRRNIAKGQLDPDNVQILYVQKERGRSTIHTLKLDKQGQFRWWPPGFFEEGYREAMALAEAAARTDS